MGLLDKAKDMAEKATDAVKDVAGKLDDKAEEFAQKDGIIGKIAGTAHSVLDKVDGHVDYQRSCQDRD